MFFDTFPQYAQIYKQVNADAFETINCFINFENFKSMMFFMKMSKNGENPSESNKFFR